MKARIIRFIITWLLKNWPYLVQEIVVGHDRHIHKNPRKLKGGDA